MTIASATNKSGPYFYNGSATSFAYQFKISNAAHIRVVETVIATGVETDLVLNTDYTVTGVGADTGNVVITPARAAGKTATLVRNVPFTQLTVLENQGAYFAKVVEGALDAGVARDQQLQEQISRAVLVPISADASDLEDLVAGIVALLDNVDAVVTVAGISGAVTTVAANAAPTSIVAANIAAVVVAASNMATIIAVPALATQVAADRTQTGQDRTAVAANKALVDTAKAAVDAAKAGADADVALTHADAVATAADRVQTGLDRTAAAASAASVTPLATQIHAATGKTIPVDADELGIWDSVSTALRKLTLANLKAALLAYFGGVFPRYDAAQAVALTQAQRGQLAANMGQAWELIATSSPAAASTVDFPNLSAFRMLRIRGYLLPATDNVALYLRTSTDNGATFSAGASDYAWQVVRGVAAAASSVQSLNSAFLQASISTSIGNGANEGLSFEIELVQFNQAVMTRIISHANEIITDGSLAAGTVGGLRLSAAAENAVRLLFSSGNIASGYVSIEGMR